MGGLRRVIGFGASLTLLVALVAVVPRLTQGTAAQAAGADPIPGYLAALNVDNILATDTQLVAFGPRRADTTQAITGDDCTPGTDYAPTSTIDMASNYMKTELEAMGYTVVLDEVPGYGYNVVVTKLGSVYPNYFIDFTGHLDNQPNTPGANDDGTGPSAVVELARVLKDYPEPVLVPVRRLRRRGDRGPRARQP